MANDKKYLEYSSQLIEAISGMFEEDSEFYVNLGELEEGDNATHFIHALANLMPTHFFNSITGDKKNSLEFNHVANKLCFQFGTKKESDE